MFCTCNVTHHVTVSMVVTCYCHVYVLAGY